jgi:hypothetical protein
MSGSCASVVEPIVHAGMLCHLSSVLALHPAKKMAAPRLMGSGATAA